MSPGVDRPRALYERVVTPRALYEGVYRESCSLRPEDGVACEWQGEAEGQTGC